MLAAGNRVILKPSEYTPACSALLREMVAATFDPTLVHVAIGGQDLARDFSSLRWDHLLYTGSADVDRHVMAAAARNLTPVTLELGGKCPAVMTPGSVTARHTESVIGTKLISHRHLDRLQDLLNEAKARGCQIVALEADAHVDRESRRMPLFLVIDPPSDLRLMQEEIFGPILPIVPYDDVAQAVRMINAGEGPLGLYVFGEDQQLIEGILGDTTSGGAAINACAIQGALPSLAFGGVGMSGVGRHHGVEGFHELSNPRGVVVRGTGDIIDAFYPPQIKAATLVQAVLSSSP